MSFLSRTAALNGGSVKDFALDMGFSLKRIAQLEQSAVDGLAACSGLTEEQLAELISWTGKFSGEVTTTLRGEIFGSRAVRNPIVRGCPVCLREDAENDLAKPMTKMTMRGDWQLREVSLCIRHQHPLVPLWEHVSPTERHDISSHLTEILPKILSGEYERPKLKPSRFDLWLDKRLETAVDKTWLGGQTLYAATTFCRLLGTELLRLEPQTNNTEDGRRRLAQSLGFEVSSRGVKAIQEALFKLAGMATGHGDEPKKAFGELFVQLSRGYLHLDAFAAFREILRECIVDIWPISAGHELLGVIQSERKLHSIHSASKETGIGPFLLEQFLLDAGAIAHDDVRPISRMTFDAKTYAELLNEIPTLVGPIELRKAMGATRSQLDSLIKDRVLLPRIDIPTLKSPWRLADGVALVEELENLSASVDVSDRRWEGIQKAKSRSGISVGKIISEIRDGGLTIGRFAQPVGYAGLCVMKTEIDQMRRSEEALAEETFITAAAFGRHVGIRDQGWFIALAAAGHAPATHRPHPKWGGERVYLSDQDVEAFHQRFLTPKTMMIEFDYPRNTLLLKLKATGLMPFRPNGKNFGPLYLRRDIEAILG